MGLFKIDDHNVATGERGLAVAKEIPSIDGQPAFKQPILLRPAIGIVGAVLHRVERMVQMPAHPGIVASGFPHQVQRFQKIHLHVVFHRRAAQSNIPSIRGAREIAVAESPVPVIDRRRPVQMVLPNHAVFALCYGKDLHTLANLRPEVAHAFQRVGVVEQPIDPVGINAAIVAARPHRAIGSHGPEECIQQMLIRTAGLLNLCMRIGLEADVVQQCAIFIQKQNGVRAQRASDEKRGGQRDATVNIGPAFPIKNQKAVLTCSLYRHFIQRAIQGLRRQESERRLALLANGRSRQSRCVTSAKNTDGQDSKKLAS